MPSFWDLVPASLLPTQPFIPPVEQARALVALAQSGGIAPATAISAARPDSNFAGTDTRAPGANWDANLDANSWMPAGVRRPTSLWELLPPPLPGQPFVPLLPASGELGPARAASPAAASASSFGPSAASAGGLATNFRVLGAAAMRPFTDYLPTQGQYARQGVDLMKQGWRDITSPPAQVTIPETVTGVGAVPTTPETVRGVGEMAWGAENYLGSPLNALIHTFIGQPAESATGIPSKYTDFAAGLALPFVKRVPGMGSSPFDAPRVPRVTPSTVADAPQYTLEQTAPPRVARPLTAEEDNRSLLYDKARNMLQKIDPDNAKLTLNPADEIPSLQDIHTLTDEISVLREQNQLWDLHQHHPFLKGKKFASKFKAVGIDPEDYITYMWARDHSALDIGPDNWTSQWRKFLNQHPEANSDMMHSQLNTMLRRLEEQ